jgi:cell division protein FtsN
MAKRRTKRRSSPPPYQGGGSAWLLLGLLLGLGVAAAMNWASVRQYLADAMQTEKPQPVATKAASSKAKKQPDEKPKNQSSNPEFDFYNILSNKKVEGFDEVPTPKKAQVKTEPQPLIVSPPEKNASSAPTVSSEPKNLSPISPSDAPLSVEKTKPEVKPEAKKAPNEIAERYLIQIASLPTYQEADRLRAELTMSGFDVYIQSAQQDKKTRYRINMGPYTSKEIATAKQDELRSQSVSSLLIKQ